MIIKWNTSEPIVARVIRNIKKGDLSEYMNDFKEWIAEASTKMRTFNSVILKPYCVDLKFFRVQIPCKEDSIAAVILNGERILPSNGPISGIRRGNNFGTDVWQSKLKLPSGITKIEETDINNYPYYLETIGNLKDFPISSINTYRVDYDKIEFSIEKGKVLVYFWSIPTDEVGYPMIPDHEDLHTACYWYCRMMLVGSGFDDPVFSYWHCEQQFEKYAARAISNITYPTVDEKKRNILNNTGLIPNQLFWEEFGAPYSGQTFDL